MCPDNTLLSAFFDGEVSSPWKDKIEDHISSCESCRSRLEDFSTQSELLQSESIPEFSSSYADVEKLIRHKKNTAVVSPFRSIPKMPLVPVAAAAAAVLAFFLGFSFSNINSGPSASYSDIPLALSEGWSIPPGDLMVNAEDVDAMLSLIENSDSSLFGQETRMDLPEMSLALHGDSQLVRSASFNGGSSR